jgi:hypothetical protein
MTTGNYSRRRFLAATGAVGFVALAGCGDGSEDGNESDNESDNSSDE